MNENPNEERLQRARTALEGTCVGDTFGGMYFVEGAVEMVERRELFPPVWDWTDDTAMAASVYADLRLHGHIDQDWLAQSFAEHYDPVRGYGPSMNGQLSAIREGVHWQTAAQRQFGGQGSFGNGGAMRAAPIGGYFADDLAACAEQAALASAATHAHPEGIAGGIAVAVAAALAWQARQEGERPTRRTFLERVVAILPAGEVREKLRIARDLDDRCTWRLAAAVLGTGLQVSAPDTVPFALWCAGEHLDNFEEALWTTLSGMGDRDTTCAIVGGIVALYVGEENIPSAWRAAREPLPAWAFTDES